MSPTAEAQILQKLETLTEEVKTLQGNKVWWYDTDKAIEVLGCSKTAGKRQLRTFREDGHLTIMSNTKPINYDAAQVLKLRAKLVKGEVQYPKINERKK